MYKGKKVIQVVASGLGGEIGCKDKLIWSIPEDMKFFRTMTLGNSLLMGRKTYESIPKALVGRIVHVATNRYGVNSIEEHLDFCVNNSDLLNTDTIYVVGGSQIYSETEKYTDEIYLTLIYDDNKGADSFFDVNPYKFFCVGHLCEIKDGWYKDRVSDEEVFVEFRKYIRK